MRGRRPPRTLRWLLARYLEERVLRPATAETYRKVVEAWIRDTGATFLPQITRQRVLHWRTEILSRASPETWNRYRRHMRALLGFAIRRGWRRGKNPFAEVGPAPGYSRRPKTVDGSLVKLLINRLEREDILPPGWLWAMIVRDLYFTGVRRRQLVGLRWGDVSVENGTWILRAETSKTRREYVIPIADPVIRDMRELRRRTALKLGRPPSRNEQVYNVPLFHRRYKGPELTEPQLTQAFARISQRTGIRISPHRLRHTAATEIVRRGDLTAAQHLLGHASIQTTIRYVHPQLDHLRTIVNALPLLDDEGEA